MIFFLTFGGTLTAGLLKLHYLWSENFFEVINFETIKHVCFKNYGFWSIFFHNFDERFPAALCKLHSSCPKNIWRDFISLKTPGMFCQFRIFGKRFWAPLQKKFRSYFENSIRGDQRNNLRKSKFFKEFLILFWKFRILIENFLDFWQKKLIGRVIYYDFQVSIAAFWRKMVFSKQI